MLEDLYHFCLAPLSLLLYSFHDFSFLQVNYFIATKYILGVGNGNPLQYSCLANPMDRRTWWAAVHGVTRVGSDQIRSVAQSCPTLCHPMNRSMPGLPAHHQLPEFTQTHVHRVSDAIQPSHPLSSPSPPAPNPSQHQSLFQWVNTSHEVAKVLEFQL